MRMLSNVHSWSRMRRGVFWALLCAAAAGNAGTVLAQTFPSKPIRVISGSAPGGAIDTAARVAAKELTEGLGQAAIVEYRTGAGGTIGADYVAKSAPDGYTVLLASAAAICIAPAIYPNLPYNPARDLAPITQLVDSFAVLTTSPSLPVSSVRELLALAKSRQEPLHYGSAGVGTHTHLAMELLKSMTGIKAQHIPYKGQAPALQDLMAGRIDMMMTPAVNISPLAKQGKLKVLGYTSGRRSSAMPDVPTIGESAVPGFQSSSWYGLLVPGGTPADVVMKLNAPIAKALNAGELKELLRKQGLEAVGNSPEEFAQLIKSELPKWAKVVKESGAKFE